ncbi:MAG TPA: hypothetical protein VFO65_06205, partial [Acidimicrobiales bacterium]|nr:hypothetical protein [Acidimicrobiales bacterium]
MSQRTAVYVYAHDPISQAGLASQLRARQEIEIIDDDLDRAAVAVVVVDEVDDEATRVVRAIQRNDGIPRVVLVVTRLDDAGMMAGVEAGACGLLRRSEAQPERLVAAILAATTGDGS